MLKLSMGAGAVLVLVVGGGWLVAQSGPAGPKKADTAGRYSVSPMGTIAVMVETMSGKAWVLHPDAEGMPGAWLPTERIDDPQEARKWLTRQEEAKLKVARERQEQQERQHEEERQRLLQRLRPAERK